MSWRATLASAQARSAARRLVADRSGASAVMTGLSLAVVLGFAGLGVDLGVGYHARRSAQSAADSAAFSGAAALLAGTADVDGQARAVAASYGLAHGQNGVVVTVNDPPASGPFANDPKAVEVIVERPLARFFSQLFVGGPSVVRARAVAKAGTAGDACVIALHETASASALETGTADVNLVGCSLFANSNSATAFELKGSASVRADSVGIVGGYSVSNNSTLTTKNGVRTGERPIEDPYKDVQPQQPSGCSPNSLGTGTYTPRTFCNGVTINSGAVVTFEPGVYVVDRGLFRVNGGATLKGEGVTIVLTSSTGSDYAQLHINGDSTVSLSAPTSGPYAGLVFYQDRRAAAGGDNIFNGGATQSIRGAIYFPNQTVTFTGGSSTSADGCTQILASKLAFRGNTTLGLKCEGAGVRMAGGIPTVLVE